MGNIGNWIIQKVCLFLSHEMALLLLSSLSLTSFETMLLDCVVTAVISVYIKKKSKLAKFCVAILIWKMGENMQHCRHAMLYYFKKGKNATETKKKKHWCTV